MQQIRWFVLSILLNLRSSLPVQKITGHSSEPVWVQPTPRLMNLPFYEFTSELSSFVEPFERRTYARTFRHDVYRAVRSRTYARTFRRDVYRAVRTQDLCTDRSAWRSRSRNCSFKFCQYFIAERARRWIQCVKRLRGDVAFIVIAFLLCVRGCVHREGGCFQ
jgi:hypothetical protein